MSSDLMMRCIECGTPVKGSASLCPFCSGSGLKEQAIIKEPGNKLSWEADMPLLTNPLVFKQLVMVVFGSGLFMVLILSFIFLLTGDYSGIVPMLLTALLVTVSLGVGLFLVALLFLGNRTRIRYTIDQDKALAETLDKRALLGTRLAFAAGLIGGNLQAAGTGVLAASREKELVFWKDLQHAEYNKKHLMIVLNNSWRPVMLIICRPENYDLVAEFIGRHAAPIAKHEARPAKPLFKWIFRTFAIFAATAPLFTLSASVFLEFDLFLPLILLFFSLATLWLIPLFGWVVIVVSAILAVQLLLIGIDYFGFMYPGEQVLYIFAFLGLGLLSWFACQAVKGRFTSLLLEN